jgi:predicted nucleotidyltransferase
MHNYLDVHELGASLVAALKEHGLWSDRVAVIIYGSAAREDGVEQSDIDALLIVNCSAHTQQLVCGTKVFDLYWMSRKKLKNLKSRRYSPVTRSQMQVENDSCLVIKATIPTDESRRPPLCGN